MTLQAAEPQTDKELEKLDIEENVVSEDTDDVNEVETDDDNAEFMQKIALFVDAYKKTAKVVEEGMERINKHVAVASKKIGKEIVETFQKMKRDREEL